MKIEILFPEFCNLYGDLANMDYLRRCLPQAEFVETSLQEEPLLAREKVDMVYLGPMTERLQEAVLEKLRPLRARIWELIDQDTLFLCHRQRPGALRPVHRQGGRQPPGVPVPLSPVRPAGHDAPPQQRVPGQL